MLAIVLASSIFSVLCNAAFYSFLHLNVTEYDGEHWLVQHSTLALLKEMLFTLDLAVDCGNAADRAAADRLQRKCGHCTSLHSSTAPRDGSDDSNS